MPDILILETPDWTLQVWCRDIEKPAKRLKQTLKARDIAMPQASWRFDPPLLLDTGEEFSSCSEFPFPEPAPLFFENRQYEFSFDFSASSARLSGAPVLHHRLKVVEGSFHFSRNVLRGVINTGNDIGWFRLRLDYIADGKPFSQSLSFQVFPVKMDMQTDVAAILDVVDRQYPLWRFSAAQKTEHDVSRVRKPHEEFLLLWLANFSELRRDLEKAVKHILNMPHSRLLPYKQHVKADRLKGRIGYKLEEQVMENLAAGEFNRRYQVTTRKLSVDTPENQFVKMMLLRSVNVLSRIRSAANANNRSPEQQPLSESFFAEIEAWKKPLENFLARPLFGEIGDFNGLNGESLVLHQKAGYAEIYRIWQKLKLYLDVFDRHTSIPMRSIAELYEIWCLLEIRNIFHVLGFEDTRIRIPSLVNYGLEKKLQDGFGAAFLMRRGDIEIRLAHEPVFRKSGNNNIYSFGVSQKPDILVEATFGDGRSAIWIFDAKYRIADFENTVGTIDLPPDDAINQMHRYRDALVYAEKSGERYDRKSRPVLGAYVLYPGWIDEASLENPFRTAIDEVGVGAFPLLPGRTNLWLKNFLTEKFGDLAETTYSIPAPDRFYVEESARIPYKGMRVEHYHDLVLAVTAAPEVGRSPEYIHAARSGKLGWYHTQLVASERLSIARYVMEEIRYCAIAIIDTVNNYRKITSIYPVRNVSLVKRSELTVEQTGKEISAYSDDLYWLFELGSAFPLANPVIKTGVDDHHYMKLTGLSMIEQKSSWEELEERYVFIGS